MQNFVKTQKPCSLGWKSQKMPIFYMKTADVQSVETFPLTLVKLATTPFPPQTKFNFEQNGWK